MQKTEKILKVAIFTDSFPVISETFVLNHIVELINEGHDVKIFALQKPSFESELIHKDTIIYKELRRKTVYLMQPPLNRFEKYFGGIAKLFLHLIINRELIILKSVNPFLFAKSAFNYSVMYRCLKFNKPETFDIIHSHFGPVGVVAQQIFDVGFIKGRLVTSFHGYDANRIDIVEKYKKSYSRLFVKNDFIVVNSKFLKNKLVSLSCRHDKIKIFPVCVDTEFFKPEKLEDRERCIFQIISIGRLSPVKGFKHSIIAVRKLIQSNPERNIRYIIAGGGEQMKELSNLITELKIDKKVKLIGAVTKQMVKELLDSSNALLLTSQKLNNGEEETQGLVIQEAQAMELPVVVSDIGGVSEGIIDKKTGFLVNTGNIDEIVEKLTFLFENPEISKEMGVQGRHFVRNKFSCQIINKKIINEYLLICD
jgi:colanic acid/amylovoran biosynthesis glycosyltransferase